jgi:hypothetical protein
MSESVNITGKVMYVIIRMYLQITFTTCIIINLEALPFRYVVIRECAYVVLVYNIINSFKLF